jgi:hypothetical protein
MRKKDEEVIKKVVDKIIDSKVLLKGDGDFHVETLGDTIMGFEISNLFSVESRIHKVIVRFAYVCSCISKSNVTETFETRDWAVGLIDKEGSGLASFGDRSVPSCDLAKSPSFKRLVEYIEENKHLILHNDKEYGKCHALTAADFI